MIKSIATAAALGLATFQPAMAQAPICGPTLEMWEGLGEYGETRQSIAIHSEGEAAVETWANVDTGSWTVILTSPTGVSCIALHGQGWASTALVSGDPA